MKMQYGLCGFLAGAVALTTVTVSSVASGQVVYDKDELGTFIRKGRTVYHELTAKKRTSSGRRFSSDDRATLVKHHNHSQGIPVSPYLCP